MSFTGELDQFGTQTAAKIDRVRRGFIVKIFGAIIKDTPVKSGRLRGDWRTSVGSPVIAAARTARPEDAAVAEVQAGADAVKGDETVYFRNNQPYAGRIEFEGYSSKAPEGMMRRNVARGARLLDEAVREAKA